MPVTDLDQDEEFWFDEDDRQNDASDASFLDSLDYSEDLPQSHFDRVKQFIRTKLPYELLKRRYNHESPPPQTELRNYSIKRLNDKLNKTILVFAVFIVFTLGIMFLSRGRQPLPFQNEKILLSNSTHHFHPTTIMISLDGFHPHYISAERTPALRDMLVDEYGPPYMTPSFPSSTFPNHWTLVTGLYPSEHGIVGNTFYDPKLKQQFINTNPKYGLNPDFWRGGQPIWTTAAKQGVNSAIHMWPGSEVPGVGDNGPLFVDKYNGTESFSVKLDRIMGWLDIEDIQKRPQLILAYVPTIDQVGHKKGIAGDLLVESLKQVDAFVASVKSQLALRNLLDIVNLVVVSDHGMAPTSNDRVLILDDLVDLAKIDHIDGWPLFGLRPAAQYSVSSIYQELSENLSKSPLKDHYNLWKAEEIPEEFNFGGEDLGHQFDYRLAPIWIVPNVGYSIVTKEDFSKMHNDYHPKGVHGYNNTELLMRAIFLGSGPYFKARLPENKKVLPFANTDVYNIICESLHIQPSANNGTQDGYSVSSSRTLPSSWSDALSYPDVPFDVEHIVENATYDDLWSHSEISEAAPSQESPEPDVEASASASPGFLDKVWGDMGALVSDIDDAVEDTFEDVVDSVNSLFLSVEDTLNDDMGDVDIKAALSG